MEKSSIKSLKKEIIKNVGKILNDFVKIRSFFENNILYEDVPLVFKQINTDEIFTRVVDALDKNYADLLAELEIARMDYLFRCLNKDTYELTDYDFINCIGIASDLVMIIRFLQKALQLLK